MDVPLSTKSRCHGWLLSFEVIVAASFFFTKKQKQQHTNVVLLMAVL